MSDAQTKPVAITMPKLGVLVFESHHSDRFQMTESRHDFLQLGYILRGRGELKLQKQVHPCQAGDVVVMPIGQYHQFIDDPIAPMSLYMVCIERRIWQADDELDRLVPVGIVPRQRRLSLTAQAQLRRMLFEQTAARPMCSAVLVSAALQLLVTVSRACQPGRPDGLADRRVGDDRPLLRTIVEDYVAQLDQRFYESTSIDMVCAQLGMSRRRFTQLFREVTGKTWLAYVRMLRAAHTRHLLKQTNRSIISIAFECGFDDLSTFYRAFHRESQCSPSQWRKNNA